MPKSLMPEYAIVMFMSSSYSFYYDFNEPIRYDGSSVFENQKRELFERITEIYEDCKDANWDDEGAQAITSATWATAEHLVDALPYLDIRGNAFATYNGKIGFQWLRTDAAMSVLVEGSGKLTYAIILRDGTKKHGYEIFGGSLPSDIREHLLQISNFA
jgi:hypothetical protein